MEALGAVASHMQLAAGSAQSLYPTATRSARATSFWGQKFNEMESSGKLMSSNDSKDGLMSAPKFHDGKFDLDSLDPELRESGVVVALEHVDAALKTKNNHDSI